MFYFQKNGLYPIHLHSKGQKTIDIAKPSKRTPASSSTSQNYIYTHIQSQLFLCWWEHAYITCLGETLLRKGNKRFQNSCTSVTWWAKHRAGTQDTTGWYWVSHVAQWLRIRTVKLISPGTRAAYRDVTLIPVGGKNSQYCSCWTLWRSCRLTWFKNQMAANT